MEGVYAAEQAVTDREAGLLHSRIWRGLIYFSGRMGHNLDVICPGELYNPVYSKSPEVGRASSGHRQTQWRKDRWAHCQDPDCGEGRPERAHLSCSGPCSSEQP